MSGRRKETFDERAFSVKQPDILPDFGLWGAGDTGPTPVIRTPAPVAPGSETSRESAALVSVDGECLRCLLWYAKQSEPRTRQELAVAVYPPKRAGDVPGLGPACGRVNLLVTLKYLAEVGTQGRRATLAITDAGRAWLAKRGEIAA